MVLHRPGEKLQLEDVPDPEPGGGRILIVVEACCVCRADLHIDDGDLNQPKLPLVPGHEIVGRIVRIGKEVVGFKTGIRVGVLWPGYTCGNCLYCEIGRENLCDNARFTGYALNGGYAELCDHPFLVLWTIPGPSRSSDIQRPHTCMIGVFP
ncbi:MAG: alcohol dehydrogenase catalytic domain-containing protein [Aestuariivirga sp.]|nr:alcohol dehydrogenase catalytic domain-containing protein [Aestuariivirga sp.]